ncbi:hypothetical protein NECAME_17687 [Necator americanus]|nr:hypothetical protein NECAME_17687 [Necator americanus]ETN82537.1 hypothetical protein NECAME_17687 [Necator americanus]
MCRQFLIEFGECRVLMGSSRGGEVTETTVSELLPNAFTPAALEKNRDDEEKETSE